MASSPSSPSKSNRDDRKRKAPNSSPSPSSPSSKPKPRSPKEAQEDAIAILNAVVEFRSGHGGSMPTPTTMEPLFLSIKPRLHEHFASADHLHTRFRSLRERFRRAEKAGVGPTPFDRVFFDLSAKAWGASANKVEDKPPAAAAAAAEEEAAASDCSLKYVTGQARKVWEQLGLSTAALEVGLKFADRAKGAALERRWRAHFEEQLKIQAQSEEVQRNVVINLIDGLKGKGKGKGEGKSAATS